ncbi:hypothetical protein WJX74_005491 [Apatococcus lobatus]|uniref:Uncharacterized protein n=1 Tax=Apatococcus lobatus TaxID=904363 RepID=A0AAW1QK93_9CHLO
MQPVGGNFPATGTAVPGSAGATPSQLGAHSPEYTASQEQLFYMSEKMLSFGKDDFNIKDINGHTVFKVDASLLSMKGARALTDAAKHTILTLQHKLIGSGTWEIYRGNGSTGEKIAIIKKPHGLGKMASGHQHQGPVVGVHFASHAVGGGSINPDMVVVGDVMGKGYTILQGSTMVAEVSRALAVSTSKFKLGGKDAYAVRVLPGVDCTFILALAVIVDELFHD